MLKILSLFLLTMGLVISACQKSEDSKQANQLQGESVEEHRCANCGMVTNKYPTWEHKVISFDRGVLYFDGARCMFKVLLDSAVAPKRIDQILVKDYYTLDYIDGKRAFYVIGSDVLGPMGHELIPFATRTAAEEFLREHQGKEIILFAEVDRDLISRLIGKMKME